MKSNAIIADIESGSSEDCAAEWSSLAPGAERRRALGAFMRHLAHGEAVARAAAMLESGLTEDRRLQRFFVAQARQEASHCRIFDTAATVVGAPALRLSPDPYSTFDSAISRAAARHRFSELIVATQVVLEALGEALLARLEAGLVRYGAGFGSLRRRIIEQEASHHAFGVQWTMREIWACRADAASLSAIAKPYVAICDAMIDAGAPALEHFSLTPAAIRADFRARLPVWTDAAR